MRILNLTVIILIFLLFGCSNDALPQFRSLKPFYQDTRISVIESGNIKSYYKLESGTPNVLLVRGPGKLNVFTRAILNNNKDKSPYSVLYRINGGNYNRVRFSDIQSSGYAKLKAPTNNTLGTVKVLEIDITPGDNSIEIKTEKNMPPVIAKYSFKKIREKKTNWVMLSPSPPSEPVDLVTRENVIHYYRFSEKKPLKIRINGPTLLRVLTRFENHYNMKGTINYRIQVKEDGNIIHTYMLSSVYSEVTTYKKNTKTIPGKAREFFIQVPSGRHSYNIIPLDKDKSTILGRVLFPKKDVKLEE